MATASANHWGQWIHRLAGRRLRSSADADAAQRHRAVPQVACEHCGQMLNLESRPRPQCTRCGDGNPDLALYSRFALASEASKGTLSA